MINIHYQKRRNTELFKRFQDSNTLFVSHTQNFIPIYNRFFQLNETNYNAINLNHSYYITDISHSVEDKTDNLFVCKIKNTATHKTKERKVFFKMAPLLDPYKYMIGKYDIASPTLFQLPTFDSTATECHAKVMDVNNAAYVDSFFVYLSSMLRENYSFLHGLQYYGSFLAIKNQFKVNIFDDLEYLNDSEFFNKHKNKLFQVDNYQHLFQEEPTQLQPIHIGQNVSLSSLHSFNDSLFEDLFVEESNHPPLPDMVEQDMVQINSNPIDNISLKSSSTCSSRSSYTQEEQDHSAMEPKEDDDSSEEEYDSEEEADEDADAISESSSSSYETVEDEDEEEEEEEEVIYATLPTFPVQIIAMEHCEYTFDHLILNNELTQEEWFSAFMQIIMTLIAYQKAFSFTHNDLHTNNVMYSTTEEEYIYYVYKKKLYKIPTYGRIYKIIDFGRSIYKFNGKLFCSDSFKSGGDASTQYNIEPYFDEKKPRLEPNPSFDLCRLACSIFDYLVEDLNDVKDLHAVQDPVTKLIVEWCLDDKGVNMLYKNDGSERYPEFKLYKMIARCVHKHTPQAQLERPEFSSYLCELPMDGGTMPTLVNIDDIPSL